MIKGTGIDLIETKRVQDIIERKGEKFLDKVFTEQEQQYCRSKKAGMYESFAARFAAKEAVLKMLGTGWNKGVGWRQIEITTNKLGSPSVELSGTARERSEEMGITSIHISLSHTEQFCVACAVGEGE